MIKQISLSFFFLFIAAIASAQDVRTDIKQMYKAYAELKHFSMEIEVKIYKQREDRLPSQTIKGLVKRDDKNYLAYIDKHRVMVNNEFTLYIDEKKSMIIYRDNKEKRGAKLKPMSYDMDEMGSLVDSIISKSDSVIYNGVRGSNREYLIESKTQVIQVADVMIDTTSGIISKVIYYYNISKMKQNNKVEVEFKNLKTGLADGDKDFITSGYLATENGRKVGAGKYKGYRVFKDTKNGLN